SVLRLVIRELNPGHLLVRRAAVGPAVEVHELGWRHVGEAFAVALGVAVARIIEHPPQRLASGAHYANRAVLLDPLALLEPHALHAAHVVVALFEVLPAVAACHRLGPLAELLGRERKADVSHCCLVIGCFGAEPAVAADRKRRLNRACVMCRGDRRWPPMPRTAWRPGAPPAWGAGRGRGRGGSPSPPRSCGRAP